jgi:hypothetical protein
MQVSCLVNMLDLYVDGHRIESYLSQFFICL